MDKEELKKLIRDEIKNYLKDECELKFEVEEDIRYAHLVLVEKNTKEVIIKSESF